MPGSGSETRDLRAQSGNRGKLILNRDDEYDSSQSCSFMIDATTRVAT
jgi:hypothetical protein